MFREVSQLCSAHDTKSRWLDLQNRLVARLVQAEGDSLSNPADWDASSMIRLMRATQRLDGEAKEQSFLRIPSMMTLRGRKGEQNR